jgi:hypothetical protein
LSWTFFLSLLLAMWLLLYRLEVFILFRWYIMPSRANSVILTYFSIQTSDNGVQSRPRILGTSLYWSFCFVILVSLSLFCYGH